MAIKVKQYGCVVLVIDDDETIHKLFEVNLNKLGCSSILVSTAEQAIALFIEQFDSIDFIITDIALPGIGGKELAATLRNINPQVKIIVSSGNSFAPEMLYPVANGFDAAYEKDFNRERLKAVLTSLRPEKQQNRLT